MAKKDNKNESKAKKHFFKDFKAELKKVIWPTPKQLVNNTSAVVAIVLVTTAIVFVLDAVFDMGNKYGISKMQNIVNERYNKEESSDNGGENTDNQENTDTENSATEETTNDGDNSTAEDSNTTESNTESVTPAEETTTDGEQTNPEQ